MAEFRIPFKSLLDPPKEFKNTSKRAKRSDPADAKRRRKQAANQPITLTDEQKEALTGLREALASAALLYHPKLGAPLVIHTDAGEKAAGGVLHQLVDGELQPIRFFSS